MSERQQTGDYRCGDCELTFDSYDDLVGHYCPALAHCGGG